MSESTNKEVIFSGGPLDLTSKLVECSEFHTINDDCLYIKCGVIHCATMSGGKEILELWKYYGNINYIVNDFHVIQCNIINGTNNVNWKTKRLSMASFSEWLTGLEREGRPYLFVRRSSETIHDDIIEWLGGLPLPGEKLVGEARMSNLESLYDILIGLIDPK